MTLELKTTEYFTLFDIKFYECMLFYRFKIYVFLPKMFAVEMPLPELDKLPQGKDDVIRI